MGEGKREGLVADGEIELKENDFTIVAYILRDLSFTFTIFARRNNKIVIMYENFDFKKSRI